MKVRLDENLGTLSATFLSAAGFDVVTVADQNLLSTPDPDLARLCAADDRCLVTLDRASRIRFDTRSASTQASSWFDCTVDSRLLSWNVR